MKRPALIYTLFPKQAEAAARARAARQAQLASQLARAISDHNRTNEPECVARAERALREGADPMRPRHYSDDAPGFPLAAHARREGMIQALVGAGADPTRCLRALLDLMPIDRRVGLRWSERRREAMDCFLRAGASLSGSGQPDGASALHLACHNWVSFEGAETTVGWLLERGACPIAKDDLGRTAVDVLMSRRDLAPDVERLDQAMRAARAEQEADELGAFLPAAAPSGRSSL